MGERLSRRWQVTRDGEPSERRDGSCDVHKNKGLLLSHYVTVLIHYVIPGVFRGSTCNGSCLFI